MDLPTIIPRPNTTAATKFSDATAAQRKAALVSLGLDALNRGEWAMVKAINHIIRTRGWRHE